MEGYHEEKVAPMRGWARGEVSGIPNPAKRSAIAPSLEAMSKQPDTQITD